MGEPSSPTPSRTGPSRGTITFVARRQLSPVRPPERVGDVVAEEVAGPDRRRGHPERRAREVGVDDRQPVGDHRSAADRGQERGLVLQHACRSSIRSARPATGRSRGAQVVDDVGAVAEQLGEELEVGQPGDRPVDRVADAVQAVRPGPARSRRLSSRGTTTTTTRPTIIDAEEQHGGDDQRRRGRTVQLGERQRPPRRAAPRAAGPRRAAGRRRRRPAGCTAAAGVSTCRVVYAALRTAAAPRLRSTVR